MTAMITNSQKEEISQRAKSRFGNLNLDNLTIDYSQFLDKESVLIVNPEMFLEHLPAICAFAKHVTMWTSDEEIGKILSSEYKSNPNITVMTVDIYNSALDKLEKFKSILCMPLFEITQDYQKKCETYANGPAASAAELLINSTLTDDGTLTILMPDNVNKNTGKEEHFRSSFAKYLVKVINLSDTIVCAKKVKPYLYQFSKKACGIVSVSPSINEPGKEYKLEEIISINSSWKV